MDADSKLIVSWLVGNRDAGSASAFVDDLASRLKNRIQLTDRVWDMAELVNLIDEVAKPAPQSN